MLKAALGFCQTAAAFLIIAHVSPASAQSRNSIEPTDPNIVSPGGVDMRSGEYIYSSVDRAIGSISVVRSRAPRQGDSTLQSIVWIGGSMFFTHNWNVRLVEHRVYTPDHYLVLYGSQQVDYKHLANRLNGDYRLFVVRGPSVSVIDWSYSETSNSVRSTSSSPPSRINLVSGAQDQAAVYSFRDSDGSLTTFLPMGQNCGNVTIGRCALVDNIVMADGTTYSFAYDTGVLRTVTSNKGFGLRFFYGGGTFNGPDHICLVNLSISTMPNSAPCNAPGQLNVSYSGSSDFLITKPDGRTERIVDTTNPAGEGVIEFYQGGSSTPWLSNISNGGQIGVSRQEFATGEIYTYDYERAIYADPPANAGGSFTAPDGSVTVVNFQQEILPQGTPPVGYPGCPERGLCSYPPVHQVSSGPTSVIDPLGRTTTMDYCDPGILAGGDLYPSGQCLFDVLRSVVDPEGGMTEYEWAINRGVVTARRQHPKPGSSAQPIEEFAEHTCTAFVCDFKITKYTDGNGNETDYEYSSVHGELLKETSPPDSSGVRPETRYTYAQRYAWLKDSAGGYSQAATPVWVLLSEEYCATSAADSSGNCAAGASDEVVTTYEYQTGNTSTGSNVLMVGQSVTADGETLRTCYGFDELGRQIFETQPKADLATCQ